MGQPVQLIAPDGTATAEDRYRRDLPPELLTWLYETMVVTRDLGLEQRYQGSVEVMTGEVDRDLEHYLRGREPGEVPALLRAELLRLGLPSAAQDTAADEVDLLRRGLAWAQPGDLVAILVHVDRDEVQAELHRLGAIADPEPTASRPA